MTPCAHSAFLVRSEPMMKNVVGMLARKYDYASVLGTDDSGISFGATPGETRTSEPMWVQRGFVFRVQKNGVVAEYATSALAGPDPARLYEDIAGKLDPLLARPNARTYPLIPDAPDSGDYLGSVMENPFTEDPEKVLNRLVDLRKALTDGKIVVSAHARCESVAVSRFFVSPNRSFRQSFAWSQAYIFGIARSGSQTKMSYRSVSGRKGLELLKELESSFGELRSELSDIVNAVRIEPGEYEVILDPDVAGTLAHEAFGHGVETDMFLKERAKAVEYLGKRVGSDLVTMYDGADGVDQTGSFLFDDEGTRATKTLVIDKGILRSGISDSLSALSLGIPLTGNGRRQAFSHKAYARMTNTYFAPGDSTLEEMVAATKRGWLLSRLNAGMEDPRNWGIQLLCLVGREIVDGKFTGRIASPVVCSGYVPDVLGAIDMISRDFRLAGSGACGKGYKEYVKVSSGGPYVKTRMRLG